MKKTILVLLVLSAVLFSAVAGDFHYGIESKVDYSFDLSTDSSHDTPNTAKFAFSPYIKGDFFTVRLLAEWKPEGVDAHGFDYLLDFNAENPYELTESVLKYIDYVKVNTGIFDLYVGRGDLETIYKSNLIYDDTATHYKAEANINAGIARIYAGTTDFEDNTLASKYNSTQHVNVVFDLSFLEIEADAIRQAVYKHDPGTGYDFNRIIAKAGATLKPGPVTVGVFYSTDFDFAEDSFEINHKPLRYWVLEAEVGLKLGFFDLEGTFFLNNQMPGYRSLKSEDGKAMFGFALNAKADIADFVRVNIDALVPLKLNEKLAIERDGDGNTLESIKASVDVGTWWRVGASVDIHGLVSSIEAGTEFLDIVKGAKPVIHAGIYTETFDLSVKGAFTDFDPLTTAVTVSAAFRVDNFFSSVTK